MLHSLDGFLRDVDTDRTFTRRIRRALFDRQHFVVTGPKQHTRALVLKLASTYPATNGQVLACDEAGHQMLSIVNGEVRTIDAESTTANMMRSALRQDPDTILTTSLEGEGVQQLFVNAGLTGHQVVGALAPTDTLDPMAAHLTPWVIALDDDGKIESVQGEPLPERPQEEPRERHEEEPVSAPSERPAWRMIVDGDETRPSRIGASSMLLPTDEAWPQCPACERSMFGVLQLDTSTLPEDLRIEGVLSLFVCNRGCGETKCRLLHAPLVEHAAPDDVDTRPRDEGQAGGIASFARFSDATSASGDKLGGWPAWVQGDETPECPQCTKPMFPLVQLDDSPAAHTKGRAMGWDDEKADVIPGEPRKPLFVESKPVHLPGLFTYDARAWIFRCTTHTDELKLLWQT